MTMLRQVLPFRSASRHCNATRRGLALRNSNNDAQRQPLFAEIRAGGISSNSSAMPRFIHLNAATSTPSGTYLVSTNDAMGLRQKHHQDLHQQESPFRANARHFSSRRKKKDDGSKQPPTNERLIKMLMRSHGSDSPDSVEVRAVIHQGAGEKARVELISLSEAIKISTEQMADLIGVEVTQQPPVIKIAELAKLEYQKKRTTQTSKKSNATPKKKSCRFRAAIDEHDLERKIADIEKTIRKGADCDVTIFSRRRMLRQNENVGKELLVRIEEMISEFGRVKADPQHNPEGTFISFTIVPVKSK